MKKEREVHGFYKVYLPLKDCLSELLEDPERKSCLEILEQNSRTLSKAFGSTNNHQNWPGGLLDHLQETINIARSLFELLNGYRKLPFKLSDAVVVLFLHDIEKAWKYENGPDGLVHRAEFVTKADSQEFRLDIAREFGITLSPEQVNALHYCEGELDDYSNKKRIMGPLAAFCHACDNLIARLWFDHPQEKGDEWVGAGRTAS